MNDNCSYIISLTKPKYESGLWDVAGPMWIVDREEFERSGTLKLPPGGGPIAVNVCPVQ